MIMVDHFPTHSPPPLHLKMFDPNLQIHSPVLRLSYYGHQLSTPFLPVAVNPEILGSLCTAAGIPSQSLRQASGTARNRFLPHVGCLSCA